MPLSRVWGNHGFRGSIATRGRVGYHGLQRHITEPSADICGVNDLSRGSLFGVEIDLDKVFGSASTTTGGTCRENA